MLSNIIYFIINKEIKYKISLNTNLYFCVYVIERYIEFLYRCICTFCKFF